MSDLAENDNDDKNEASSIQIERFGSCRNGLDLPGSDLDIVVTFVPPPKATKSRRSRSNSKQFQQQSQSPEQTITISTIAEKIRSLPWARDIECISTSRVPVVKFLADGEKLEEGKFPRLPNAADAIESHSSEPHSNDAHDPNDPDSNDTVWKGDGGDGKIVPVDITISTTPTHLGLASTSYVTSRLPTEEPQLLKGLVLVVKELLMQKKLNKPWSGGLGSYGIFLLCLGVWEFVESGLDDGEDDNENDGENDTEDDKEGSSRQNSRQNSGDVADQYGKAGQGTKTLVNTLAKELTTPPRIIQDPTYDHLITSLLSLQPTSPQYLSQLLLFFLYYYGFVFDGGRDVVSVGSLPSSEKGKRNARRRKGAGWKGEGGRRENVFVSKRAWDVPRDVSREGHGQQEHPLQQQPLPPPPQKNQQSKQSQQPQNQSFLKIAAMNIHDTHQQAPQHQQQQHQQHFLSGPLMIVNPVDNAEGLGGVAGSNNVGASCWNFEVIKRVFGECYDALSVKEQIADDSDRGGDDDSRDSSNSSNKNRKNSKSNKSNKSNKNNINDNADKKNGSRRLKKKIEKEPILTKVIRF